VTDDHAHGEDGHVIIGEPSPAEAEAEAVETVASAEVETTKILAERDVTIARIAAGVEKDALATDVEAMKAELRGMREVLDRLMPAPEPEPEPEPAPVIIDNPSEPAPDMAPAITEHHDDEPHKPAHGMSKGWFG
jgi:hypothetical protein